MKLLFAGTPEFSIPSLRALCETHHEITAVLTQPDRRAGRGLAHRASPIKSFALENGLTVLQPKSLKNNAIQTELANLQPDLMIVIAYGLILPQTILDIPKYGCINVHASLLPHLRGAAPIVRAIEAGDSTTGITIMQMDAGLDTGDMLLKSEIQIQDDDTGGSLHDKLSELGATLLIEALDKVIQGTLEPQAQDDTQATYAEKISKQEGAISWSKNSDQINNLIRAFHPWPVAFTTINDQKCRIWQAEKQQGSSTQTPGTIVAASPDGIDVATGNGLLRILQLQLPGGKVLGVRDLLNSKRELFSPGKQFGVIAH